MTTHLFYYTIVKIFQFDGKKCLFCVFFPIERVVFIFCKAGTSCITALTIFVWNAFVVPTLTNCLLCILWRSMDVCISGSISLIGVVNYNWIARDEISIMNFSPFFNPKLRPFLFSICLEQNEASLTSITSQTPKVRLAEDGISSTLLFFVLC